MLNFFVETQTYSKAKAATNQATCMHHNIHMEFLHMLADFSINLNDWIKNFLCIKICQSLSLANTCLFESALNVWGVPPFFKRRMLFSGVIYLDFWFCEEHYPGLYSYCIFYSLFKIQTILILNIKNGTNIDWNGDKSI